MNSNKILNEIQDGYALLEDVADAVTVFGSARVQEGTAEYESARQLGALLAQRQITVITGGGPGIMEAANRGAYQAGGESIGLNIVLPFEQRSNPYLTRSLTFEHFYVRKVMLVERAKAFIVYPGGFGTLDELFEVVNLMNTFKLERFPLILVGRSFWQGLVEWVQTQFAAKGYASAQESRFVVVDTAEEALSLITSSQVES